VRARVVVFARAPVPGRVKTRLTPPFTPEQAAELYGAMLDDVLETTAAFARVRGVEAVLALTPASAAAELARRVPPCFRVEAQRGPDLSRRMDWAVREAFAAGCEAVLLRGSDSPALTPAALEGALAALAAGADLALSPDPDGGYGLVALRGFVPGLFDHAMGTAAVLAATRSRAEERGLVTRLLEPGFDIDRAGDLEALADARRADPTLPCPRTLRLLDERDLWRQRLGGG